LRSSDPGTAKMGPFMTVSLVVPKAAAGSPQQTAELRRLIRYSFERGEQGRRHGWAERLRRL